MFQQRLSLTIVNQILILPFYRLGSLFISSSISIYALRIIFILFGQKYYVLYRMMDFDMALIYIYKNIKLFLISLVVNNAIRNTIRRLHF